jgi:oxaloacetate decarboxylase (Na+ extruding) subunit alpha
MAALVDTSIRLLSQEPLSGRVPTRRLLEVAAVLDEAGFAYLEVSGGGCFDAGVRRGVESPWEIIRGLRARCSSRLGIALRGRFLVGQRPLSRDLVRRFVKSAADAGIDVFRLHDPLNDLANLREAAEAIHACEKELAIGLVHSPGPAGEADVLLDRAQHLSEFGAARVLLHDPAGSLDPAHARELVGRIGDASGLPVGLHAQGAAGAALAAAIEAVRADAAFVACAIYPVAILLHRVPAEAISQALAGIGHDTGVNLDKLWEASEIVDDALGDDAVPPLSPRVAVRAAEHSLPAGLVAEIDENLRAQGVADRLDAVLEEMTAIREECGWPPLASPIGQALGSQAIVHVLSAQRWQLVVDEVRDLVEGRYGTPQAEIDPAVKRSVALLAGDGAGRWDEQPQALEEIRGAAEGLAASEEELLLLALFGQEAEPLLRAIRSRGRRDHPEGAGVERSETERIRELIRVVQESGIAEVTIEEGETRLTVRRAEEPSEVVTAAAAAVPGPVLEPPLPEPARDDLIRVEAPMVGTFYRAPSPEAEPFVDVGDAVEPGQTLCILEAMKLMNEVKAEHEALVRRVCVENEQAVEYGTLLFELEPLNGRPLDAL